MLSCDNECPFWPSVIPYPCDCAEGAPASGKFNSLWVKFSLDTPEAAVQDRAGTQPHLNLLWLLPKAAFLKLGAAQSEENVKMKPTAKEAVQCQPHHGTASVKELC